MYCSLYLASKSVGLNLIECLIRLLRWTVSIIFGIPGIISRVELQEKAVELSGAIAPATLLGGNRQGRARPGFLNPTIRLHFQPPLRHSGIGTSLQNLYHFLQSTIALCSASVSNFFDWFGQFQVYVSRVATRPNRIDRPLQVPANFVMMQLCNVRLEE
jgi:hypothetical protein